MVTTPTGDEGQQGERQADADHPFVEGGVGKEAQPEKRKEPNHEGHRGAVNGAQHRGADSKPVAVGL